MYAEQYRLLPQLIWNLWQPQQSWWQPSPLTASSLLAPSTDLALALWPEKLSIEPGAAVFREKCRDSLFATALADSLLETALNDFTRARLLATSTKESGAWLYFIPLTALSVKKDDHTLRVAVGLRLGTAICVPHQCQHCDEKVNCYGTHGLSCCYITDMLQLIPLSTGLSSQQRYHHG